MTRSIRLVLMLVLVMGGAAQARAASPSTARPAVVQLGGTSIDQNGIEYVGRVLQNTTTFQMYGYLTHLDGLSDQILVSNTNPISHTDSAARFTFVVDTTLTARTVISDVTTLISVDSVGRAEFYYKASPSTDFGNPQSFSQGTKIATFTVRLHSINNVQAPGIGLINASADLKQMTAAAFSIGNKTYRLGRHGRRARLTGSGEARRLDLAHSVADIAGDMGANG